MVIFYLKSHHFPDFYGIRLSWRLLSPPSVIILVEAPPNIPLRARFLLPGINPPCPTSWNDLQVLVEPARTTMKTYPTRNFFTIDRRVLPREKHGC